MISRVIFLLTDQARVIFLITEEKIYQKSTNQKQELPVVVMFVNRSRQNEHSLQRTFYRSFIPSFGSFDYAVSEDKSFKNRPIRNNNYLWRPCLLMDRDKMSNLYRGRSIGAAYQISVDLGTRFQRLRFFRNQPIKNKNGLWRPCLLKGRDEMSNLYRGPIDASCQVSFHLAKRFQKRRFLKIGQSETRNFYGGHVWKRVGTK